MTHTATLPIFNAYLFWNASIKAHDKFNLKVIKSLYTDHAFFLSFSHRFWCYLKIMKIIIIHITYSRDNNALTQLNKLSYFFLFNSKKNTKFIPFLLHYHIILLNDYLTDLRITQERKVNVILWLIGSSHVKWCCARRWNQNKIDGKMELKFFENYFKTK